MADLSAEEAFLQTMRDKADAEAVQYEAEGANGKQTESTSSDEYDPAQAVPDTFSPKPAQEHLLSPGVVKQNPFLQSSDRPSSASEDIAATGPQDQAADENDGRSQSRSMSGSSSSSSPSVNIQTNSVPFQAELPTESTAEGNANLPNASHGVEGAEQASLSSALSSLNSTSNETAKRVQSGNHVPEQVLPGVVTNGAVHAASDQPVSLPKAASERQPRSGVETAPELPALQDSEAKTATTEQQKAAPALAIPKARLPNDTIGILEDRIQEDPRGDMNAWLNLIEEYRKRGKIEDARATYERFFVVFPAAVSTCSTISIPSN